MRGLAFAIAVGLSSAGCFFVVPKTRTKTTRVWEEKSDQQWAQPANLSAEVEVVTGPTVTVRTVWTGSCAYDRAVKTEKRRWRGAGFKVIDCGGGSDCGYAYVFGIIAAPITIPVSALITWASIAGDETTTIVETEHKPTLQDGCVADAAGVGVTVVGKDEEVPTTTDARGRAQVTMRDEASARAVTVHVHTPPGGR